MRAATAAVILAFCATNSFAAPAPYTIDPGFSLRCLDNPNLECNAPSFSGLGKRNADASPIGDVFKGHPKEGFGKSTLPANAKRDVAAPVEKRQGFLLGIRLGAALGKKLLFGDKAKRDADAEALIGAEFFKAHPEFGFDEPTLPALPDKRDADALLDAGNFFKMHPEFRFDEPTLAEKRDVDAPLKKRQGFLIGIRLGLALGKQLLFHNNNKVKRDALIDDLPVLGGLLDKLPVVGQLDEIVDKLPLNIDVKAADNAKRDAEPLDINSALTWWANEVLDDSPYNPFDDPGLPGKRDAAPLDINSALTWWANEVLDDSPYNPFDDPGLPGKRMAKRFTA